MRIGVILMAVAIFSGCFNRADLNEASVKKNEAIIAKSRNYILENPTDYSEIEGFNEKILEAYKRTISTTLWAKFRAGFVYKIIPKGVINPFSEIEVECLVRNKYSRRYGIKLCDKFFKNIEKEFKK